ncbi:tetratricopeptide repeat protein [Flavobacterium franklandianum]|uniref:histidine kinase n=1 Tax=Flavobacterium franklandianum TaxID=2594430 RepID=A0A553CTW0_9FLAO|nr:tetratricopeptide repeat-containing sensor histidine kinase [Flavobacterium franklandianum]TRX23442.1 tetratricopeptide repeat protein [Flavobacterium franklandianum]TRX23937.1 tetratricopeptide repeat protein [Flavobacterium franklandianum]
MKKIFYILLLLIAFFACTKKNSQNQIIVTEDDSLTAYLSKANDFSSTTIKREKYIQKAFAIIINQENDSLQRANLFRVANRYYNLNDWNKYREITNIVLEKAKISKDTLSIAKAYSYLGDFYGSQSLPDSAFFNYFKAEKIHLQQNDNISLARARLNKANLQYNESDFSGSEISVIKALNALKSVKSSDMYFESYNLLGLIYNELGDYGKAIDYHNKALKSIDEVTIPVEFQSKPTSMNNLGLVYQNLNKDKLAIPYFLEGLKQKKDLILYKPFVYALLLDNLGYSRFKIKESIGLPALFYESFKIRDSLKLTIGVIVSQIHLSEYYASKGDKIKALQYSNEALQTAQNSKNNRNLLLPLKQLAIIEPTKAAEYNKEYIHINDSLQKADRNIAEKFSRIEYETDEIKQENTNLTVQNRNLVYIFGSILILGLFLYIIKAQKAKNRELLYKQEQQKANEEIYNLMISQQSNVETIRVIEKKRVAQELHDGVLGRMFGVRMNLDSLNNFNDELASKQRNSYIVELKNIEQDIREISHDLSREKSELINNFVAIVDNLFEEQKKTFNSKLVSSIDSSIKWDLMTNAVKINLYRVVQESLQNINKYANAKTIKVEFKKGIDNLLLQISDDGVGFNVKKAKKGIGLLNMLSRIDECNGVFEIQSRKGEGTIIKVTIPI